MPAEICQVDKPMTEYISSKLKDCLAMGCSAFQTVSTITLSGYVIVKVWLQKLLVRLTKVSRRCYSILNMPESQ